MATVDGFEAGLTVTLKKYAPIIDGQYVIEDSKTARNSTFLLAENLDP